MTLYNIAWFFVIYSFLGWCLEVVYQATKKGKVINRGFLCGPVCPVYGFGVLAVLLLIREVVPLVMGASGSVLENDIGFFKILIIFVCGIILATLIELTAGWILYTAFHARWWDYSNEPFNFHGFICLRFSIIWGIAIVFVVSTLQPLVEDSVIFLMPERIGWPALTVIYLIYLIDLVVTVSIVVGLNRRLAELDQIQSNMRIISDHLSEKLGTQTIRTQQSIDESRVQMALAGYEARDGIEKRQKELAARAEELRTLIMDHPVFGSGRILSAFPDMRHRRYSDILAGIQEGIRNRIG